MACPVAVLNGVVLPGSRNPVLSGDCSLFSSFPLPPGQGQGTFGSSCCQGRELGRARSLQPSAQGCERVGALGPAALGAYLPFVNMGIA